MNMAVHIPQETSYAFIGLDELRKPALRLAAEYWSSQCTEEGFPSRDDIKPQAIASVLRHMSLVKVLDGDYAFRVVGDGIVRAFAVPIQNRKLSEIALDAPIYGTIARKCFTHVVEGATPLAMRGTIGRDSREANFTDFENALFPLGSDHRTVQYILTVSAYTMRPSSS
jgi:hypothetical protein